MGTSAPGSACLLSEGAHRNAVFTSDSRGAFLCKRAHQTRIRSPPRCCLSLLNASYGCLGPGATSVSLGASREGGAQRAAGGRGLGTHTHIHTHTLSHTHTHTHSLSLSLSLSHTHTHTHGGAVEVDLTRLKPPVWSELRKTEAKNVGEMLVLVGESEHRSAELSSALQVTIPLIPPMLGHCLRRPSVLFPSPDP